MFIFSPFALLFYFTNGIEQQSNVFSISGGQGFPFQKLG